MLKCFCAHISKSANFYAHISFRHLSGDQYENFTKPLMTKIAIIQKPTKSLEWFLNDSNVILNPFLVMLYPLKTSENLCFFGVLRGYKMEPLSRYGLI